MESVKKDGNYIYIFYVKFSYIQILTVFAGSRFYYIKVLRGQTTKLPWFSVFKSYKSVLFALNYLFLMIKIFKKIGKMCQAIVNLPKFKINF